MNYLNVEVVAGQHLLPLAANHVWGLPEDDAPVGIPGCNRTGLVLGPQLLARHLLAMGAIGSGKSNALYHVVRALRHIAGPRDTLVFFDAKGDYLKLFGRDQDIVISPRSTLATARWNIYQEILATPSDERDQTIREIAASLFQHLIEHSQNPVFPAGARDIFYALLTAHTRAADLWDNAQLRAFISRSTVADLRALIESHEDLRWVLSYVMSDKGPTTQSYLSPLYQAVQEVLVGEFGRPGDFSMRQFVTSGGGRAVFLEYDLANARVLSPIYALLLDLAMKEMLGRNEDEEPRNTYFVLDEFPLMPKLNYMENALNFGRSLGVRVVAGIQNAAQVETQYGASGAQSLLAGFGTIMGFRLFDDASRRILQQRHGMHKVGLSFVSSNAHKGVVDQIVDGHVVEVWDIAALETGRTIVSLPMGEPFVFQPTLYEE